MKKIERTLGDYEKFIWLLDQAASLNFTVVARVEGELNLQAVNDSLDALIQMHPLLTTQIEKRDNEIWIVTNDKIKPSLKILERENDKHWHLETEKEINAPFDCGEPLLRVTLLHSAKVNELLFTFFHSISDANSGVFALRDFMTLVANWKHCAPLAVPQAYPVRPPVEELLPPAAHGWSKFVKTVKLIFKQTMENLFDHPRKLSVIDTPRKQRTTKIIHTILPQETVDRLVAKSRENKTTAHGGLCAALLLAISRKIESGNKLTLNCSSVVNLRDKLSPQLGDEIGMLASGAGTSHTLRPTPEFWSLAREIKQDVNRAIDSGEIYIMMKLVGSLIPKNLSPCAVADKLTETFSHATIVTNIGKVQIPENYGSLRLTELHFAACLKSLAGQEFNLAAATFANQMHLNFIYTYPNLSDKIANEIASDTIAILEENL